jgi:hypothetical protein
MEKNEFSLDNLDVWLAKNPIPPIPAPVQREYSSPADEPLTQEEDQYVRMAIKQIFFEEAQKVQGVEQEPIYGRAQKNKKYPCLHCGKGFIRKFDLKRHVRVPVKKYQCFECIESFTDKRYFKNHFTEVHRPELKPLACTQCVAAFMKAKDLQSHLRYVHSTLKKKVFFDEKKVQQLEQYVEQSRVAAARYACSTISTVLPDAFFCTKKCTGN